MLGFFCGQCCAVCFEEFFEPFHKRAAGFDTLGYGTLSTGEGFKEGAEAGSVHWGCWDCFAWVGELVVLAVCGCCEASGGSYCLGDSDLERYERLDLQRCCWARRVGEQ